MNSHSDDRFMARPATPRRRPVLGGIAVVAALLLVPLGALGLKLYLWDVLVLGAGEPDRSMVFWALPVAMIGVSALGAGVLAGVGAWWWLVPRVRGAVPEGATDNAAPRDPRD